MKSFFITIGVAAALGLAAMTMPASLSRAGGPDDMPMGKMGDMHGMKDMKDMSGMDQAKGDDGPASLAYQGANNKMHRGMAIEYSGDADVDFARGMIPHHQGAIDMAKIALAFGQDPEIRQLAETIVKAQEAEIALMQAWLKGKGQ